jgi:hypothetical protein
MAAHQFFVTGDPLVVRDTLDGALAAIGFASEYSDPYTGTAKRGSKGKSFWLGAMAGKKGQYLELGLSLRAAPDGTTVVGVSRRTSGAMGGVIGVANADASWAEIVAQLRGSLYATGLLLGDRPA